MPWVTSRMTEPIRFPADQPAHPLDYWLSPELAQVSPHNAKSRLRQLADAQGTFAAAWSSAIAAGPVLVLTGGFTTALSGNAAWVGTLGTLGVALLGLGLFFWRRVRTTLPDTNKTLITRGPGGARGGIVMVSFLAAVIGAILSMALPAAAARGTATLVGLIGAYLLIVALLVAAIVVPSVVMGRARQSFRRRVQTDADLRRAVESDLLTWRDPYGSATYGPL
jgi:hypothetical protein